MPDTPRKAKARDLIPKRNQRFTDEFRASAVAMAIAEGYPGAKGALVHTAAQLGISHQVLRNWVLAEHNPPPQELLRSKKFDLRNAIQQETERIFDVMGKKRDSASYAQLGTVFGILFDKSRLLDGLPTEYVHGFMAFLDVAKRKNLDPMRIVEHLVSEVNTIEAEGGSG